MSDIMPPPPPTKPTKFQVGDKVQVNSQAYIEGNRYSILNGRLGKVTNVEDDYNQPYYTEYLKSYPDREVAVLYTVEMDTPIQVPYPTWMIRRCNINDPDHPEFTGIDQGHHDFPGIDLQCKEMLKKKFMEPPTQIFKFSADELIKISLGGKRRRSRKQNSRRHKARSTMGRRGHKRR